MGSAVKEAREARAKEQRKVMAAVFAKTQQEMGDTVDKLAITRRSAVPYKSSCDVPVLRNPVPLDAHLIPSHDVIVRPDLPKFEGFVTHAAKTAGSGSPWAAYEKATPDIFVKSSSSGETGAAEVTKAVVDEEMWRAQYMEWVLQKNAYNPDIAAQLR